MILDYITIKNIGVHTNTHVKFSEGINLVTGLNMSGKSSLLNTALSVILNTSMNTLTDEGRYIIPDTAYVKIGLKDKDFIEIEVVNKAYLMYVNGNLIEDDTRKVSILAYICNLLNSSEYNIDLGKIIKTVNRISGYAISPFIVSTPVGRRSWLSNTFPVVDTVDLYEKCNKIKKNNDSLQLQIKLLEDDIENINKDLDAIIAQNSVSILDNRTNFIKNNVDKHDEILKLLDDNYSKRQNLSKLKDKLLIFHTSFNLFDDNIKTIIQNNNFNFSELIKIFDRSNIDKEEKQLNNKLNKRQKQITRINNELSILTKIDIEPIIKLCNNIPFEFEEDIDIINYNEYYNNYKNACYNLNKLSTELNNIVKRIEELKAKITTTDLTVKYNELTATVSILTNDIKKLDNILSNNITDSICPTCGSIITKDHIITMNNEKNSLLSKYEISIKNLESLKRELEVANEISQLIVKKDKITEDIITYTDVKETYKKYNISWDFRSIVSVFDILGICCKYLKIDNSRKVTKKEVFEVKNKCQLDLDLYNKKYTKLKNFIDTLENNKAIIIQSLNGLAKNNNVKINIDTLEKVCNLKKSISDTEISLSILDIQKEIHELEQKDSELVKTKFYIQDLITRYRNKENELNTKTNNLKILKSQIIDPTKINILLEAFGTKGIPVYSLMKLSKNINDSLLNNIRKYLPEMNIKLEIDKNKVLFNVVKDDGSEYDVSKISGSESRIIAICVAISVKEVMDGYQGINIPNFIYLDEIESGISEEYLEKFFETILDILQTNFKQIIFISPNKTLLNYVDNVNIINLTPEN